MRENSTVKIVSEEFSLLAYLDSIFLYALYQHNVAKITEIAVLFEDLGMQELHRNYIENFLGKFSGFQRGITMELLKAENCICCI